MTWSLVLLIVLVGSFALQKEDLGPYFAISGQWYSVPSQLASSKYLFIPPVSGAGSAETIRKRGCSLNAFSWVVSSTSAARSKTGCYFTQELLTIAISFVLYTLILLRVRGSTVISKNKDSVSD